ncbi:MAG: hypothetical protein ACRBN8_11765 [Nannocystales bacterium]
MRRARLHFTTLLLPGLLGLAACDTSPAGAQQPSLEGEDAETGGTTGAGDRESGSGSTGFESNSDSDSEDGGVASAAAGDFEGDPEPQGALLGPTSRYVGTFGGEWTGTRYEYAKGLRVGGAYLHPIQRYAIPFVEANGSGRRIEYRQLDANPGSSSFGNTVGSLQYVTTGSSSMKGMASTSVVRGTQTDGVFAFYDAGQIRVFEVNGATAAHTAPSVVRDSLLFGGPYPIIPAVEAGRWGSTSRILMANSSYFPNFLGGTSSFTINFGLLNRASDGSYSLEHTGSTPVQPAGSPSTCTSPFNDIAAAWDTDLKEWTVTWMCGSSTYLQRVGWNGVPLGAPFLLATHPSDESHSGVMISYNKHVNRFLVQFQHNLRVVRRYGSGYRCMDRWGNDTSWWSCSANDTSDRVPAGRLESGSQWATEVDYNPGAFFRLGGRCIASSGCESSQGSGHGVSYEMTWLDEWGLVNEPQNPRGWTREEGVTWPSSSAATETHRYIRAPQTGRTAVIHVRQPTSGMYGTVRASWVDEGSVAIDE